MDYFFRSLGYRIEPGESHACWRAPAHVAGGKEALAGRYSEAQRPGAPSISRVENGHTVLSIETLEKLACALEVPLYQLFYEGDEPPALPDPRKQKTDAEVLWGSRGERARMLGGLLRSLAHMDEADRRFLLLMAQKIASRRRPG